MVLIIGYCEFFPFHVYLWSKRAEFHAHRRALLMFGGRIMLKGKKMEMKNFIRNLF